MIDWDGWVFVFVGKGYRKCVCMGTISFLYVTLSPVSYV